MELHRCRNVAANGREAIRILRSVTPADSPASSSFLAKLERQGDITVERSERASRGPLKQARRTELTYAGLQRLVREHGHTCSTHCITVLKPPDDTLPES